MARIEVPLTKGLKLGDVPQKKAVLESLDSGPIIEAAEDSEKLIYGQEGPVLVQSPSRLGAEILRRQIKSIGDIPGPLSLEMLGKLSGEDYALLDAASDDLDQAIAKEIESLGRNDATGEVAD